MSDADRPRIDVTIHPPERGRAAAPVVLPCACCTCCCCCLHSVGSLAGAIVGTVVSVPHVPSRPADPNFPFPFRRDEADEEEPLIPAGLLYWLVVSFLLGVGAVWAFLAGGARDPWALVAGLVYGFMLLPGVQLVASVVSMLLVAVFYGNRGKAFLRLSQITGWSLAGAVIGVVLMGVGFVILVSLTR
jgi:hypothetical protein